MATRPSGGSRTAAIPCAARTSLRSIRTRRHSTSLRRGGGAAGDVPPHRAVLAANMETALNGVWDAAPGPADRIAVVGAGVVGSLVAYLCGRMPGADVTLVDINASRAELAAAARGWFRRAGKRAKRDCDLVVHASGSPDGLRTALELAGDEATVLEMSWYGDRPVTRDARRARFTAVGFGWYRARSEASRRRIVRAGRYRRRLSAAIAPARRSQARCIAGAGDCLQRFAEAPAGNSCRRKRHTLSTHRLFVRSRLVHRRSSRPHHDRAFVSRARFSGPRRRCMARPSWSMPPSSRMTLDANGIVIDIGRAHDALKAILGPLNYRNLDDIPEFKGKNTTTEFLSKHIYDGLAKAGPRRTSSAAPGGNSRHCASRSPNRTSRVRHTRRPCGEARRLRGAGQPRYADRRLRLRPADHGRTPATGLGRRMSQHRRRISFA